MPINDYYMAPGVTSAPMGSDATDPGVLSRFDFLSSSPPPWLLWVTTAVVVATFLWRIYVFLVERHEKKEERRLSVEDEFWHRLVISPICIEPLVEFVKDFTTELRMIHSQDRDAPKDDQQNKHKKFLEKFKDTKDAVLTRFIIIDSVDSETYETVSVGLDDIDDVITQHCVCYILLDKDEGGRDHKYCNISIAEQAVYSKLRDIFGGLKRDHAKMFEH